MALLSVSKQSSLTEAVNSVLTVLCILCMKYWPISPLSHLGKSTFKNGKDCNGPNFMALLSLSKEFALREAVNSVLTSNVFHR